MFFEPFGGLRERLGFDAAGAALSVLADGDEAGAFEDFEVFGDGGLRHGEGLGELIDGGFPGGEASEDSAASGIGEGGESGVESFGRGHCITLWLYNHLVIHKAKAAVKQAKASRVRRASHIYSWSHARQGSKVCLPGGVTPSANQRYLL